jgi:hypothetical protein
MITITSTPTAAGGFSTIATVSSHEPDVRPENNSATAVTTVPEGPPINPTGPDLTGAWQSVTQRCKGSGETKRCKVRGSFVVENRGQQKASPTLLRFYLSSNGTFDSGDILLKDSQVNAVKVGRTKRRSFKLKLPTGTDVTGQIVIAVLDSAGAVTESSETNNTIASPPLP